MTDLTVASLLLDVFAKDHKNHALGRYDGKNVSYHPVDDPLTEPMVEEHLAGETILGCYQLLPDSTVSWIAWDVDSLDTATAQSYATQILRLLQQLEVPHVVEWSGHKGYHIFIFLAEPIPAEEAKQIADTVRGTLGLPASGKHHVECFPKQPALTVSSPYGNLIKLPLGLHPATKKRSRFVDPVKGWEGGEEVDPILALQTRATKEQAQRCLGTKESETKLLDLVTSVWKEGDRHHLALALSGYLATSGWGLEQTRSFMEQLCHRTGDTDVSNRLTCVEDTFRSMAENQPVVGYSRLRELLPADKLTQLTNLVSTHAAPSTVRQVDSIRTGGKAPTFLRVRAAEAVIWSVLSEEGAPLKTPDGKLVWYEDETHSTHSVGSREWDSLLAERFGLNMKDSFGVQVVEELSTHFMRDAEEVLVQRRSSWNGKELYVHLDGEEVFILDGSDTMRIEYNGDCGIIFQNLGTTPVRFDPNEPATIDVWDHLVNDLSFASTEDAPATPEQQRELLKAWVMSFFFPELMPTRPILCCLGKSGSGKTSAARRILWVLEDPSAEVLEPMQERPDAIRVSMGDHKFIVLDNLERSNVRGLVDVLNRAATGSVMEQRRLYTDSEVYRIRPDVFIALTAVNLPFSEETLFTRLLPLELAPIPRPLAEWRLQKNLKDNRNAIWKSMLLHLNEAVASILANPIPELPSTSRLADFVGFASQLRSTTHCVNYEVLEEGLQSLVHQQERILMQSSPFVEVLEIWLRSRPDEAARPHTATELNSYLLPIARSARIRWQWTQSKALERHMGSLHDVLVKEYGIQIGWRTYGSIQCATYSFPWDGKDN